LKTPPERRGGREAQPPRTAAYRALALCRGTSAATRGYDDAGIRFRVAHGRLRTGRRGCRDGRATQHE